MGPRERSDALGWGVAGLWGASVTGVHGGLVLLVGWTAVVQCLVVLVQ